MELIKFGANNFKQKDKARLVALRERHPEFYPIFQRRHAHLGPPEHELEDDAAAVDHGQVDLTLVEREYRDGILTLRELADKHGYKSDNSIRRLAAKHGWVRESQRHG